MGGPRSQVSSLVPGPSLEPGNEARLKGTPWHINTMVGWMYVLTDRGLRRYQTCRRQKQNDTRKEGLNGYTDMTKPTTTNFLQHL